MKALKNIILGLAIVLIAGTSVAERGLLGERIRLYPTTLPTVGSDGDVRYDTSTEELMLWTDTGAAWQMVGSAAGANTALSNLVQPLSINANLQPDVAGSREVGTTSKPWDSVATESLRLMFGTNVVGFVQATASGVTWNQSNQSFPDISFTSDGLGDFSATGGPGAGATPGGNIVFTGGRGGLTAGSNGGTANLISGNSRDANTSGLVKIGSGLAEDTNGSSNNVEISTGVIVGGTGTRGKIKHLDGSEGTPGNVWTEGSVAGEGSWAVIPASSPEFLSNVFRVNDNIDPTKQMAFGVSGISVSTLRTITVPDANILLIGSLDARLSDDRFPFVHDFAGAQHAAGTLANLNTKVSDATLIDTGDSRLSDDRTADGLRTATTVVSISAATAPSSGQVLEASSSTLAAWVTPSAAPVEFADNVFKINDNVTPSKQIAFEASGITASTVRTITMPDINVTLIDTGDSRLSDARTPTAHALGGAEHSADSLADLNTKVSDATLIDTGDSRLSDDRTASGLRTATTVVSISASTAPTSGQVLEASSSTLAAWSTPAAAPTTFYTGDGTVGAAREVTLTDTLNFDDGNLCIDSVTERIGIGTTTPTARVDISESSGTFGGALAMSIASAGSAGFYYATSASSQNCNTTCEAEDGNAGFGTGSGFCLAAWDSTASSGSCAQSSADRRCLCAGAM